MFFCSSTSSLNPSSIYPSVSHIILFICLTTVLVFFSFASLLVLPCARTVIICYSISVLCMYMSLSRCLFHVSLSVIHYVGETISPPDNAINEGIYIHMLVYATMQLKPHICCTQHRLDFSLFICVCLYVCPCVKWCSSGTIITVDLH